MKITAKTTKQELANVLGANSSLVKKSDKELFDRLNYASKMFKKDETKVTKKDLADLVRATIKSLGDKFIEPVAYEQYGFVICDEIGLNARLYYGDSENVLNIGAGHSLSSHMFGESGTILVGGHDTTFFKCLDKLKKNMKVTVKTYFGVFEYKVSESKIVQGSDYEMNDEKNF